jgi:hypothetical protein
MNPKSELAVTLSPKLYEHLRAEAVRLDVPLQWLVASMVVDTVDDKELEPALA